MHKKRRDKVKNTYSTGGDITVMFGLVVADILI